MCDISSHDSLDESDSECDRWLESLGIETSVQKSTDASEHICHSHCGSSYQAFFDYEPVSEPECEVTLSAGVQPGTVPSDFSQFDQILPPEVTAYVKQKILRIPYGYVDRWEPDLGQYDPLRDEIIMCSGLYPGLSAKERHADFPNQPFPIIRRVDRGFPARYEGLEQMILEVLKMKCSG